LLLRKKIQGEKLKKITTEYDGKIDSLMTALEKKAFHSVELARQAKKAEMTIKELKRNKVDLGVEKERLEKDSKIKEEMMVELSRRIETVTQSLELLAGLNIELKSRVPPDERSKLNFSVQTDIGTVQLLQAKIDELEIKANQSNKQLIREQQKELSSQLSIRTYDRYITKVLSQQMKENMRKEALRRKAAEFQVRRLSQKVEELVFLVGEKGRSGDTSNEGTSSGESGDKITEQKELAQ